MPIRINLLAEAQAFEELRRRDPVKRVIFVGIGLVVLMLVWSSSFLAKSMYTKGELGRLQNQLASLTNEHRQILQSQNSLAEAKRRMNALDQLAKERFLVGSLLNDLQKVTVDEVQMIRLKLDQTYVVLEEVKPKKDDETIKPRPAMSTEKMVLTISAKDKSASPGDGRKKFQQLLADNSYFRSLLGATNGFHLKVLGATQQGEGDGKPFQLFTLEGNLPEKTR